MGMSYEDLVEAIVRDAMEYFAAKEGTKDGD